MKALFSVLALALCLAQLSVAQVDQRWKPNDPDRPVPPVIDPGTAGTQDSPGRPPSDAIVLFAGKDLSQWTGADGQPAKWKVAEGYMEVVPHSGIIQTRQPFGDCQLHVEFTEPTPPVGEGQERGNSGVFLMGLYEIQVLDSYQSKTYADGQASAVYAQFPPQALGGAVAEHDIIFHGRVSTRWQAAPGASHRAAQWSAGAGQRGVIGTHWPPCAPSLQAHAGQAAPQSAGPRQPRALPQYLDSRIGRRAVECPLRRGRWPTQARFWLEWDSSSCP